MKRHTSTFAPRCCSRFKNQWPIAHTPTTLQRPRELYSTFATVACLYSVIEVMNISPWAAKEMAPATSQGVWGWDARRASKSRNGIEYTAPLIIASGTMRPAPQAYDHF